MTKNMTNKQLAIPLPGFRRSLLGALPMDAAYMAGVASRAQMLARACTVKPYPQQQPAQEDSCKPTSSK